MQIKDGKFVVVNKGKPVNGKLVGDEDALGGEAHRQPAGDDHRSRRLNHARTTRRPLESAPGAAGAWKHPKD